MVPVNLVGTLRFPHFRFAKVSLPPFAGRPARAQAFGPACTQTCMRLRAGLERSC